LRIYGLELLALGVLAGLLGVALGYAAQGVLAQILGELFSASLPPPGLKPVFPALTTGLVVLAGFGLPPVLRLGQVPPLRVLRRDLAPWPGVSAGLYLVAVASVVGLMLWYAGDLRLTAWVAGGSLATVALLAGLAACMVWLLGRLRNRVGVSWRFGLANIARRGGTSVVQTVALGLGIMVLLVLTLVRTDLLESWRESLPEDAPNYFLINIQPEEVEGLRTFLRERGVETAGLYPMIRGRLTAIDDRLVVPADYSEPRAQRLVERDFNLSWAADMAPDNRILSGNWWQAGERSPQLSVEQGLAETLGIRLNDRLRFQIAGVDLEAPVSSLRSVEWDSFRPNFFVLFPPGVLDDYPATWITSFHLPASRGTLLSELVRNHPSVTLLDVAALMQRVRTIMNRVALAVEYVFVFTLLAGLLVLYAAIQATRDERVYEGALLRAMGAGRRVISAGLLAEFAVLGILAGTLAAIAASAVGIGLSEYLFGLHYRLDPSLWLLGAGVGLLGVTGAGYLATRGVLRRPPLEVLRQG
jgi:putative ABC transport system permease protein